VVEKAALKVEEGSTGLHVAVARACGVGGYESDRGHRAEAWRLPSWAVGMNINEDQWRNARPRESSVVQQVLAADTPQATCR